MENYSNIKINLQKLFPKVQHFINDSLFQIHGNPSTTRIASDQHPNQHDAASPEPKFGQRAAKDTGGNLIISLAKADVSFKLIVRQKLNQIPTVNLKLTLSKLSRRR